MIRAVTKLESQFNTNNHENVREQPIEHHGHQYVSMGGLATGAFNIMLTRRKQR